MRTLNRDGKKKKGRILIANPDYKKAYVTLKSPLSISTDLYPIKIIEEDKRSLIKESKTKSNKSSIVEEGEVRSHWLDGSGNRFNPEKTPGGGRNGLGGYRGRDGGGGHGGWGGYRGRDGSGGAGVEKSCDGGDGWGRHHGGGWGGYRGRDGGGAGAAKFPWSSMRPSR